MHRDFDPKINDFKLTKEPVYDFDDVSCCLGNYVILVSSV